MVVNKGRATGKRQCRSDRGPAHPAPPVAYTLVSSRLFPDAIQAFTHAG